MEVFNDSNPFSEYISSFETTENWLKYVYDIEKKRLKFIFPNHTHNSIFDNNNLSENISDSFLPYNISATLLGLNSNNPMNEIFYKISFEHALYNYNNVNYTFQDIIRYFEFRNNSS